MFSHSDDLGARPAGGIPWTQNSNAIQIQSQMQIQLRYKVKIQIQARYQVKYKYKPETKSNTNTNTMFSHSDDLGARPAGWSLPWRCCHSHLLC